VHEMIFRWLSMHGWVMGMLCIYVWIAHYYARDHRRLAQAWFTYNLCQPAAFACICATVDATTLAHLSDVFTSQPVFYTVIQGGLYPIAQAHLNWKWVRPLPVLKFSVTFIALWIAAQRLSDPLDHFRACALTCATNAVCFAIAAISVYTIANAAGFAHLVRRECLNKHAGPRL